MSLCLLTIEVGILLFGVNADKMTTFPVAITVFLRICRLLKVLGEDCVALAVEQLVILRTHTCEWQVKYNIVYPSL